MNGAHFALLVDTLEHPLDGSLVDRTMTWRLDNNSK